jgi:hypothetical protein
MHFIHGYSYSILSELFFKAYGDFTENQIPQILQNKQLTHFSKTTTTFFDQPQLNV